MDSNGDRREAELMRLKMWNEGKPIPGREILFETETDDYPPAWQDMDEYDEYDGEGTDEEDQWEEALMNCGKTYDGLCMLAGTEHCDWECPIADWDRKHGR